MDITIKRGLPLSNNPSNPISLSASTAEKPPHSDDSNVDPLQDQSWGNKEKKPYPLVGKKTHGRPNYCKWVSEEFPGNHLKWRVPPLSQILICDTNHIKSACIVLKYALLLVLHHQQLNHTSHLQSPIKPPFLWGFKSLFLQLHSPCLCGLKHVKSPFGGFHEWCTPSSLDGLF